MQQVLYARLAKFDEVTGYFEAIATDESLDKAKEICDYGRSKPHFQKWSQEIATATAGKSVGNVRAMHGKVVAGKLTNIEFDDTSKAIKVCGLVVDANEREKMAKGCYSGVSIGGEYVDKWPDPVHKEAMRYEARPSELSVVDYPCNSNSFFTVVKNGEGNELRKFQLTFDNKEGLAKWYQGLTDDERAAFDKIAEREDASPSDGKSKYGDVKFADEKNKKYPIDTPAHIRAAWNYINKPHNASKYSAEDVKTIKAHIVAAWKAKIDSSGPPSAEKDGDAEKVAKRARNGAIAAMLFEKGKATPSVQQVAEKAAGMLGLKKGMFTVAWLANLLDSLDCLADGVAFEAEIEGDGSVIPDEIKHLVGELGEVLCHMCEEEVEEMDDGEDETTGEFAMSAKAEMKKRDDQIAALTTELEALKKAAQADPALQKRAGDLEKANGELTTENARLTKLCAELEKGVTDAAKAIEDSRAEIEKLKKEPDNGKRPALMVVGKGQDLGTGGDGGAGNRKPVDPVLKADGSVDEIATKQRQAMADALAQPVVVRRT